MIRSCGLLLLFCFLGLPFPGWAQERIEHFDVVVQIAADATMTVTESIRVTVAHERIRHGIIRTIPVGYAPANDAARSAFEVVSARVDGQPVPTRLTWSGTVAEIRIGDPKRLLPQQPQTFELVYRIAGQVGFFPDHDELYWNVTGNDWEFAIDRARFRLELHGAAAPRSFSRVVWYTGSTGEQGQDARLLSTDMVETTRPLHPGEGLTVVYGWPKGVLNPDAVFLPETPGRWRVSPYRYALLSLCFLLVVYFLLVWWRYGRDPSATTVIPLFHPPAGTEAGFLRYVEQRRFDDRAMTAVLLALAVKGRVQIEERRLTLDRVPELAEKSPLAVKALTMLGSLIGGEFVLHAVEKPERADFLTAAEEAALGALFTQDRQEVRISGTGRTVLQQTRKAVQQAYQRLAARYFRSNRSWWFGGTVVALLASVAMFLTNMVGSSSGGPFWLDPLVSVFAAGFILLPLVIPVSSGPGGTAIQRLFRLLFPGLFLAVVLVFIVGGSQDDFLVDPVACSSALIIVALLVLFDRLLPAYTEQGVAVKQQAAGLRMYLETAERDRLAIMHPPEATPEHFEALLPYACAFDLQETWTARFSQVFDEMHYTPRWYRSAGRTTFTPSRLTDLTSGLTRSVGSTAGGSGLSGGSSGGGRGGGGGRGW